VKFLRKIASVFLISIFLLATIGVTTYKHYCHKEGTFTSIYIPSSHECKEKHVEDHACCAVKTQETTNDCCQDEVKSIKVQGEYKFEPAPQLNFQFAVIIPSKWLFTILHFVADSDTYSSSFYTQTKAPPHLSGGISYLQFLQVWRL
jgi:hypothetical protein